MTKAGPYGAILVGAAHANNPLSRALAQAGWRMADVSPTPPTSASRLRPVRALVSSSSGHPDTASGYPWRLRSAHPGSRRNRCGLGVLSVVKEA